MSTMSNYSPSSVRGFLFWLALLPGRAAPTSVMTCDGVSYYDARVAACLPCPANTRREPRSWEEAVAATREQCVCLPGYFSRNRTSGGERCIACPLGGACEGGLSEPFPLPGFFGVPGMSNWDATTIFYEDERDAASSTSKPALFLPCLGNRVHRCAGGRNFSCGVGWAGDLCATPVALAGEDDYDFHAEGRAAIDGEHPERAYLRFRFGSVAAHCPRLQPRKVAKSYGRASGVWRFTYDSNGMSEGWRVEGATIAVLASSLLALFILLRLVLFYPSSPGNARKESMRKQQGDESKMAAPHGAKCDGQGAAAMEWDSPVLAAATGGFSSAWATLQVLTLALRAPHAPWAPSLQSSWLVIADTLFLFDFRALARLLLGCRYVDFSRGDLRWAGVALHLPPYSTTTAFGQQPLSQHPSRQLAAGADFFLDRGLALVVVLAVVVFASFIRAAAVLLRSACGGSCGPARMGVAPGGSHARGGLGTEEQKESGELRVENRAVYAGERDEKNQRHGQGTCWYSSGGVYDGAWRRDLKEGEGSYRYASGHHYRGHWKAGKKHGFGVFQFANGDTHEGTFVDDIPMGRGKFTPAGGQTQHGYFSDGKFRRRSRVARLARKCFSLVGSYLSTRSSSSSSSSSFSSVASVISRRRFVALLRALSPLLVLAACEALACQRFPDDTSRLRADPSVVCTSQSILEVFRLHSEGVTATAAVAEHRHTQAPAAALASVTLVLLFWAAAVTLAGHQRWLPAVRLCRAGQRKRTFGARGSCCWFVLKRILRLLWRAPARTVQSLRRAVRLGGDVLSAWFVAAAVTFLADYPLEMFALIALAFGVARPLLRSGDAMAVLRLDEKDYDDDEDDEDEDDDEEEEEHRERERAREGRRPQTFRDLPLLYTPPPMAVAVAASRGGLTYSTSDFCSALASRSSSSIAPMLDDLCVCAVATASLVMLYARNHDGVGGIGRGGGGGGSIVADVASLFPSHDPSPSKQRKVGALSILARDDDSPHHPGVEEWTAIATVALAFLWPLLRLLALDPLRTVVDRACARASFHHAVATARAMNGFEAASIVVVGCQGLRHSLRSKTAPGGPPSTLSSVYAMGHGVPAFSLDALLRDATDASSEMADGTIDDAVDAGGGILDQWAAVARSHRNLRLIVTAVDREVDLHKRRVRNKQKKHRPIVRSDGRMNSQVVILDRDTLQPPAHCLTFTVSDTSVAGGGGGGGGDDDDGDDDDDDGFSGKAEPSQWDDKAMGAKGNAANRGESQKDDYFAYDGTSSEVGSGDMCFTIELLGTGGSDGVDRLLASGSFRMALEEERETSVQVPMAPSAESFKSMGVFHDAYSAKAAALFQNPSSATSAVMTVMLNCSYMIPGNILDRRKKLSSCPLTGAVIQELNCCSRSCSSSSNKAADELAQLRLFEPQAMLRHATARNRLPRDFDTLRAADAHAIETCKRFFLRSQRRRNKAARWRGRQRRSDDEGRKPTEASERAEARAAARGSVAALLTDRVDGAFLQLVAQECRDSEGHGRAAVLQVLDMLLASTYEAEDESDAAALETLQTRAGRGVPGAIAARERAEAAAVEARQRRRWRRIDLFSDGGASVVEYLLARAESSSPEKLVTAARALQTLHTGVSADAMLVPAPKTGFCSYVFSQCPFIRPKMAASSSSMSRERKNTVQTVTGTAAAVDRFKNKMLLALEKNKAKRQEAGASASSPSKSSRGNDAIDADEIAASFWWDGTKDPEIAGARERQHRWRKDEANRAAYATARAEATAQAKAEARQETQREAAALEEKLARARERFERARGEAEERSSLRERDLQWRRAGHGHRSESVQETTFRRRPWREGRDAARGDDRRAPGSGPDQTRTGSSMFDALQSLGTQLSAGLGDFTSRFVESKPNESSSSLDDARTGNESARQEGGLEMSPVDQEGHNANLSDDDFALAAIAAETELHATSAKMPAADRKAWAQRNKHLSAVEDSDITGIDEPNPLFLMSDDGKQMGRQIQNKGVDGKAEYSF